MFVVYPNLTLPTTTSAQRDPVTVVGLGGRYIRPTPLISISYNPIRNKMAQLGGTYDITLNGTIVTSRRSAIMNNGESFATIYNDLDAATQIPDGGPFELPEKLPEIIWRQNQLRDWFRNDYIYMEVLDIHSDFMLFGFTGRVQSISFEEGTWVDTCRYSINIQADYLLDSSLKIMSEGLQDNPEMYTSQGRQSLQELIDSCSGLVEDFNDTWSIEADEGTGQFINQQFMPRTYRLTRNMSATGRHVTIPFSPQGQGSDTSNPNAYARKEAWEHARDFLKFNVDTQNTRNPATPATNAGINVPYQEPSKFGTHLSKILSSGTMGIPSGYRGYNHVRSENFDKGAGTYSISDSWILASGDSALENYSLSVSSSTSGPYIKVSIDGNIKGLNEMPATMYNADFSSPNLPNAYDYAYQKYIQISNSGHYGLSSDIFKRANSAVSPMLNSQPLSISLGMNELDGTITYNLEFDNRPTNYFSGVLYEVISINDTYPGDLYAVLPVIGRLTGPVLQYIGGRTEYKRDVNIEIAVDYTDIGYNNTRESLILSKPSLHEPLRTQLSSLIYQLSPATEPGIRKYFLNPTAESWSPKEGRYTISLSWIYELDR